MHMQNISSIGVLENTYARAQIRHSRLCAPTQILGVPAWKGLKKKIIMIKVVGI